jgi:hypothetical protein
VKERRKLERFDLALPAVIEIRDPKSKTNGRSFESFTRDISSQGAFFVAPDPLPIGTFVNAEMVLKTEKWSQPSGYPQVKTKGHVVRTEPTGFAVCFRGRCVFRRDL